MLNVGRHHQRMRLQPRPLVHPAAAALHAHLALRRPVGARKQGEQIIEAPVLLDDDDDVLDRRAARICAHRRHRRLAPNLLQLPTSDQRRYGDACAENVEPAAPHAARYFAELTTAPQGVSKPAMLFVLAPPPG